MMDGMQKEMLKQVIADQQAYKPPKDFFSRSLAQEIERFAKDPSVIILSGIRRSGKSTIQRALQKGDYFFNFDDDRLIRFRVEDFQMLLEVFVELFGDQSIFYFDEIQNVKGWERFIRRLYDQGKKIYITGSNAKLLSKELGTHLTGRYVQFEVYPLSFQEILQHKMPDLISKKAFSTSDVALIQRHFSDYFQNGGIPDYVKFGKTEYLKDLLEGILYRDIIARYKLKDEKDLREVVYYLSSNIGKGFSYTNVGEAIGIASPHTIRKYCDYLERCYLFFFVNRYSHSLQKQIQGPKKCYMIDPALIRMTGFRASEDRGRILENIVFLHLKMQRKEIYFHKDQKECDFLIRQGRRITQAIQVTMNLSDEKTKEREIAGLIEAMKAYRLQEGLIITESEEDVFQIEEMKISVFPVWKLLLQRI
jgi:uncharacterized protein